MSSGIGTLSASSEKKTFGKFGPLIGAIDEGTSSARFIIFRANSSHVVAVHQMDLNKKFPQEGWVEQDAYEMFDVVIKCIDGAIDKLESLGGSREDIIGIGVTNQRETTVVWDKSSGNPLYNAIVWQDMRTQTTIEKLMDSIPNKTKNQDYLKPLCGLPLSPYFSASKMRWLIDNVEKVREVIASGKCLMGTVDSWIIWNLTGGHNGGKHVTDVSNASRTMLMNIETLKWDPTLLKFFEIPAKVLPEIKSSAELYGYVSEGPLKGIPICGCLGDQQAALVGQMCLQKGQAKATYGTGCFVLYNTGEVPVKSNKGLLTTVAYQFGREAPAVYALEGSVAVAGASVNWLRDNLGMIDNVKNLEDIANSASEDSNVVFVPAFSGLYAPYWRADARGVICGMDYNTQTAEIVKATLEAVCFQVKDILDAMNEDAGIPLQQLKADGGMSINKVVMQTQADLIGITVVRSSVPESTALGAALAAYWALDKENMNAGIKTAPGVEFRPGMSDDNREMRYNQWKKAIDRSLGWWLES